MARDTRERLLDVGLDAFARSGLAATTVTDIESKAGLRGGSGSFYRHFSSKEELFFAVVERELDRLQAAFEDRLTNVPSVGDARSIVALELHRVLNAMAQRDKLMAIMIRDRPALSPLMDRVHKAMGAGVDVNTDLLAQLMDKGIIPRRDAKALSVALTNSIIGYQGSTRWLKSPLGRIPADEYVGILVDLVVT